MAATYFRDIGKRKMSATTAEICCDKAVVLKNFADEIN